MKGKKLLLCSLVMVICLLLWGGGTGYTKVTGRCDNCHTMHNSQGGADLYATPYATLLKGDCVVCHSHGSETQSYALGTSTVPVVNYTGGVPATYLAGGNFYWVATAGGATDAKGHNVYGIAAQDGDITTAEKAPGDVNSCDAGSCHATLALENATGYVAPGGCQGCHLDVKHHTDDGTGTKYVGTTDKWYRFLAGHSGIAPDGTYGVEGIEDSDWQATSSATDHNEYKGITGQGNANFTGGGGTMTGFCAGCHGNFHSTQLSAGGEWTRHPSDFTIPNSGEYASVTTYGYDPLSPVARTDGAMTTLAGVPSGSVAAGADMVMCLSCHRPHGSPYNDLLRWDYANMVAGSDSGMANKGCFYCHSTKDAG